MRFLEIFSESSGQLSSSRVFMFLIALCFCGDYVMHIVRNDPFVPDWAIVGVVLGSLGMKVAQKPFENKVGEKTQQGVGLG